MAQLQALGEKILKARKALGYKKRAEFAKKLSLPENELKLYEQGVKAPPVKIIISLCNELNLPIRAFLYGKKPKVIFRTNNRCNLFEIDNIIDEILIEAVADGLNTLHTLGKISPQKFENSIASSNPEETGENFIKTYKLEEKNFNTWEKVMELLAEKDIYVFALPLISKISALVHQDYPFFIVLNSNEPKDRWSFSLLHEIGHLIVPEEIKKNPEEEENYANLFAKSVLIPKQLRFLLWKKFKNYILSWNEKNYQYFFEQVRKINPLVSPESIFYTLVQDFWDIELGKRIFGKFKKLSKKLREKDIEFIRPDGGKYFPTKYIKMVEELVKRGEISYNRKEELLLKK